VIKSIKNFFATLVALMAVFMVVTVVFPILFMLWLWVVIVGIKEN
jgi:hypothetical protein